MEHFPDWPFFHGLYKWGGWGGLILGVTRCGMILQASWERSDLSRSADGEKTLTYLARRPGPTGIREKRRISVGLMG